MTTPAPAPTTPHRPSLDLDLKSRLAAVESRTWTPRRGTLGRLLALSVRGASEYERVRIVRRFARLAVRRQGLAWLAWLDSEPEELTAADRAWAVATFADYLRHGPTAVRSPV